MRVDIASEDSCDRQVASKADWTGSDRKFSPLDLPLPRVRRNEQVLAVEESLYESVKFFIIPMTSILTLMLSLEPKLFEMTLTLGV